MYFYHVTPRENLSSILSGGLIPSRSGLDGPGVYLWRGPLDTAVKVADASLSDNHYKMTDAEYKDFIKGLDMLSVELPDDSSFTVEWPDYVVFKDHISASQITSLGSLHALLEKHNKAQEEISFSHFVFDENEMVTDDYFIKLGFPGPAEHLCTAFGYDDLYFERAWFIQKPNPNNPGKSDFIAYWDLGNSWCNVFCAIEDITREEFLERMSAISHEAVLSEKKPTLSEQINSAESRILDSSLRNTPKNKSQDR